MDEATTKIQNLKKRSMKLSEEARELMKGAKAEQKKIRTRGLCIMGNRLLSILGIRDVEAHQKIFEAICADKQTQEEVLFQAVKKYVEEHQRKTQE